MGRRYDRAGGRLLCCLVAMVSPLAAQTFDLSLRAPSSVQGAAGSSVEFEVVAELESRDISSEDGVQAWSLGVAIDGCEPERATTNGTAGDAIEDGGYRQVSGQGSFEKTEVIDPAENGGRFGVVSAVILAFDEITTLPPAGTEDLLRIVVAATVPAPVGVDECEPVLCRASFAEDLVGSGEPVRNTLTYRGESHVDPAPDSAETTVCPTPQTGYRVEVVGARPGEKFAGRRPWTIDLADPPAELDVEAHVILTSALEPCNSNPGACDGTENFRDTDQFGVPVFGCADDEDNDSDGVADVDDPDCIGVQGWSISLETDPCFNVRAATTRETVGDIDSRPPGLRDTEGGSFENTEVVDPNDPINQGAEGVVSAVVLSFTNPLLLPQVSENNVLRVLGTLDTSGLTEPDQCTEPCGLTLREPTEGLAGSGERVKTATTISGETRIPGLCHADLEVCARVQVVAQFRRCDCNGDGRVNIADAVCTVSSLFAPERLDPSLDPFSCEDALDCNDQGPVDVADSVYLIAYRFQGGPLPPAPGLACGEDPSADALGCSRTQSTCTP